jgi:hypothetical protein
VAGERPPQQVDSSPPSVSQGKARLAGAAAGSTETDVSKSGVHQHAVPTHGGGLLGPAAAARSGERLPQPTANSVNAGVTGAS